MINVNSREHPYSNIHQVSKKHIAGYYIHQSYNLLRTFTLFSFSNNKALNSLENNPNHTVITLTFSQSNDYVHLTQRSYHPIAFFRDTRVAHDVNIPARCSVSYIFIAVQESRRFFPRQGKGKT